MQILRPAEHRTILLVDVEAFSNSSRTDLDRVAVREGLYQALEQALSTSGIPWDSSHKEDRGDGVLVLARPELPKAPFTETLPTKLAAALQRHNATHQKAERIRLRMALHAGEIHHDSHGVAGASLNLAFRLLDCPSLKDALAGSPGVLALIASEWFFDEVIKHTPAANPATYRRIKINVKETSAFAWIALPDHPYPHSVREISSARSGSIVPFEPLAGQLDSDVIRQRASRFKGMVSQNLGEVAAPGPVDSSGSAPAVAGRGATVIRQVEIRTAAVVSRPVRLALQPVFLVGREELLTELNDRLTAGDELGPRICVLHGLGGAGKTSVAVEYAHRHLAEVGIVWQLPAEDPTVLAAGFGELAAQLGARDVLDTKDPVASVHSVLAVLEDEWLLVFDNALDWESVAAFLPPTGRGRVLITSQSSHWPPRMALEVPVLRTEAAVDLLIKRTGDLDEQAARELAIELDGLPLAIEQAAAYMLAVGDTITEYLASFRQRRADMLARGKPTGYSKTLATTWTLAFHRLRVTEPRAIGLLRLLAHYAPEAIPLRLLMKPLNEPAQRLGNKVAPVLVPLLTNQLAVKDALASLRDYSLVSAPVDGVVSMHRLVQAVARDQMPQKLAAEWRRAAAAVVEAAIPRDHKQPENWSDFAALLPHALAALTAYSDGLEGIARYLGFSGSYVPARDLQQRIAEARESVLGPQHPDSLHARANLARWSGAAGNWAAARDQYAALLPVAERVFGSEHPETLHLRGNLAHWTGQAGDPATARDLLAALLPVAERILGPRHPDISTGRVYFARWTGEAGDAAAARDLLAALLPVRERVSGAEHPDTLHVRGSLAHWTGQAGDAAAARDQYAALFPVAERVLGPEHPDTLHVRGNLARWMGEAGDPAAAQELLSAILPVQERVSGPEHPDTLQIRKNLTYWTGKLSSSN
jgi:tetratricopeptide repeat protein